MTAFRLEAFRVGPVTPAIVPCTQDRTWLDRFASLGPDPCPPVTLADTQGWELLVPAAFDLEWNGGDLASDLVARMEDPFPDGLPLEQFAASTLGHGVISLHSGYVFRAPPGWHLLVTGAFNEPTTGIAPLTGILESGRPDHPLIMHWRLTEPGTVRFEQHEVFCTIVPIRADDLETWEFAIHELGDDPTLLASRDRIATAWPGSPSRFFGLEMADSPRTGGWRLNPPVNRSGTRPLLAPSIAAGQVIEKWRPGSLVNSIDHAQNDRNIVGRQRLNAGVLNPSPETIRLEAKPELDPAVFDFIHEPAFLTPAECALLTETAAALATRQQAEGVDDAFWKGRFLQFGDVLLSRPGAAALMRDAQARVTQRLRRFYELTTPIFADTAALVRWRPGMFMDPHADRAHPDGDYHGFPHRDFGSIIYINDDYEGGELYFPRLDLLVKPTLGLLVAFTGGWHHEHAVTLVRAGDRLTMSAFYTFDASHRERDMYGLGGLTN